MSRIKGVIGLAALLMFARGSSGPNEATSSAPSGGSGGRACASTS